MVIFLKVIIYVRDSDCANLPWAQKNLATQLILCWVQKNCSATMNNEHSEMTRSIQAKKV
jgi:hypothetical protein